MCSNIFDQLWDVWECIGGFRGGADGAAAPPSFLYFQNVLRFCFENRLVKCSLILSSETLTWLYFCIMNTLIMLYGASPEKWSFHSRGGQGRGGTRPPLSEFSGSAPGMWLNTVSWVFDRSSQLKLKPRRKQRNEIIN